MIFFVKVKYRKLCYYKCEINIIYYNKIQKNKAFLF